MSEALKEILYMSLAGSGLAALVLLLQRTVRNRLPSVFYYGAWLLVLLRFILPIPGLVPTERAAVRTVTRSAAETTLPVTEATETALPAELPPTEPVGETNAPTVTAAPKTVRRAGAPAWVGTAVWGAGAAVSMGVYLVSYARFVRRLRKGLLPATYEERQVYGTLAKESRPALYHCKGLDTPMLLGVLHPTIVLPERSFAPACLESILRHELTHYYRRDVAIKWAAAVVYSFHWFNPVMLLVRKQLEKSCELSCDEQLLRHMTGEERHAYGETLLTLAESRFLPAGVVATTFSAEKRTLKERLEQIMKFKKASTKIIVLAAVAALTLCLCGAALGPDNPAETEVEKVTVSTVDELLAAIAPNTAVTLEPGTYDLTTASDYGSAEKNGYYYWQECYDGYELVLSGTDGLTLAGESAETVTVCTKPRYADVLTLERCGDVALDGLTVGHTEEPGYCSGGVVYLQSVTGADIDNCVLFGCGILGISAKNCEGVHAENTVIKECSSGAVSVMGCRDFVLERCPIYDCTGSVFCILNSTGVAVVNSEITDNDAEIFILAKYSSEVRFLGCRMCGNSSDYAVFALTDCDPVIDGCEIYDGKAAAWVIAEDDSAPVNAEGEVITDFDSLVWKEAEFEGFDLKAEVPALDVTEKDGRRYVTVSTVDELLAAIAPDTTVTLEAGEYLLGDAAYYGSLGGEYYRWDVGYDGSTLVIEGADGLVLQGAGADKTTVMTEPRFSEILRFDNCADVTVADLTAGHTEAAEGCGAGVLQFDDCTDVTVKGCGLFGCGIRGISTEGCIGVLVADTEIYDCSVNAAVINDSAEVAFENCDIHDCTDNTVWVWGSENVTMDGETIIPRG